MTSRTGFIIVGFVLLVIYMVGSGIWVSTGGGWYQNLKAPTWHPPDWVFGTIWPYNFLMLGISIFSVSRSSQTSRLVWLICFGLSVVAALLWAYEFYVAHNLGFASFSLLLVPILTLPLTWLAFKSSGWIGTLLLPYQFWVAIAAVLSFTYAAKN